MFDFVNGDIDVLVSTTIIETGLDIPNANTMIIHDADRMGLSQLYQLRGRVGRSSRTSYAFLMYKRDKMLKEEAERRLQAIREFTELGSGIKIAMRDLEIRGAGNVLGAEQHGHMEAVGYDLYCKLLNQAVHALKGKREEEEEFQTVVDCDINAYIPGVGTYFSISFPLCQPTQHHCCTLTVLFCFVCLSPLRFSTENGTLSFSPTFSIKMLICI